MAELKERSYENVNRFVLFLKFLKGVSSISISRLVPNFYTDEFNIYDRKALDDFLQKATQLNTMERSEGFNFSRIEEKYINEALDKCQKCEQLLCSYDAAYCTRFDDIYPWRIRDSKYLSVSSSKTMSDFIPNVLYYKGDPKIMDFSVKSCGIIGMRQCLEYAREVGKKIGMLAASCGFSVVGGVGMGCDSSGHEGCLAADGKTIGVMPCGMSGTNSLQNGELADSIVEHGGLLLCEQFPDTSATPFSFVNRDRILALLCDKVIVLQASSDKASLRAVENAYDFGKQIYVLDPNTFAREDDVSGNRQLAAKSLVMKFIPDNMEWIFAD